MSDRVFCQHEGNNIKPLTRAELEKFDKEQLIDLLLLLFEQNAALELRVAELEERINQNSTNSSKPPSSDGYDKPSPKSLRKKSGKKPGGQYGHQGHGLKISREIKRTVEIKPEICPCCGNDLHGQEGKRVESRYEHEIPEVTVETTRYDVFERQCPQCGTVSRGGFPERVTGTQQYGPRLRAYMVMLLQYGMVGMQRLKNIIAALFGVRISEGTIASTVGRCAGRLGEAVEAIKGAVIRSPVVCFDETGMRNRGVLWWLHTASTGGLVYLQIHPKRGNEAMEAIGILPVFCGVAVHDCLKSYWAYVCLHALCNAHVLRELVGILENTGQAWAGKMIDLLVAMKDVVQKYRESGRKELSAYYRQKFSEAYDKLVRAGQRVNPAAVKVEGKRGRTKQSKGRLLVDRLKEHKEEYLRFIRDFDVPFDNNQAERDFRMGKVKQKVSGCFRSDEGALAFATIQTFIQTIHKHHLSIWDELVKVFQDDYSLPFEITTE
jgi:transposase